VPYVLCCCFRLFFFREAFFTIDTVALADTNQGRLKLPAGFPGDMPFTDDAYNLEGQRNDADKNFFIHYQSDKKLSDVISMYRAFIKRNDSSYQETKEEISSIFMSKFPAYDLFLMVSDIGTTNVYMTLNYRNGLPSAPANTNKTADVESSISNIAVRIETNQNRLKLPAFIPKDIPFAKDAVLVKVDDKSHAPAGFQEITVTYNSMTGRNDVTSIYKSFTRSAAKSNNESNLGGLYTFASSFEQYDMQVSIMDSYTGGKTLVSLKVVPTYPDKGVFVNHYAVTDYSTGKTDSSGVSDPNGRPHNRLIVGNFLSDPPKTNIFMRKNDHSLWGFSEALYKGAEKSGYGNWKASYLQKGWALVDKDAYCLDTEGDNYYLLQPDGSLWTYGSNYYNWLASGEVNLNADCPPTKVLDNVRTASIGKNGSAVTKDGSLWIWGNSSPLFSVLNNPEADRLKPEKVMDNVADAVQSKSIAFDNGGIMMVLKNDGSLWTWGEGNCGDGGVTYRRKKPIKIMDGVKTIDASNSLCCAIKTDDSLWVWESYSTSSGKDLNIMKPEKILDNVKMVSPGERFLVALKNDGTVWSFGYNSYGQCGIGSLSPEFVSKPRKILEGAMEIGATDYSAFALMKDGRLMGWGLNDRTRAAGDYDWLKTSEFKITAPKDIGFNAN